MELQPATQGILENAISADLSNAIFAFLQQLPLSGLTSVAMSLTIALFLITSADSCAIMLGTSSTGGDIDPKTPIKAFWGIMLGVVTIICLFIGDGGINALQAVSLVGIGCYSLYKCLKDIDYEVTCKERCE